MKCIDVEKNILDFLENEIENYELNAAIEVHISSCSKCRELYHRKKEAINLLKTEVREASDELVSKNTEVMKSIEASGDFYSSSNTRRLKFHLARHPLSYVMSALIITIFIFSGVYFNSELKWVFSNGNDKTSNVDHPNNTDDSKFAGIVTKPSENDPNSSDFKGLNPFEIYLVKDLSLSDAIERPLKDLVLDEKPILTDKDILSYNWTNHTMKISQGVISARFSLNHMAFDAPFVAMAQGKRLFLGSFRNPRSSAGFPEIPYITPIDNSESMLTIQNYGTGINRENYEIASVFTALNKLVEDIPIELVVGKIKESNSTDFSYINIEKSQVLTNKDDLNLFRKTIFAKRINEEEFTEKGLPKYRVIIKYSGTPEVKTKTLYFTPGSDCYYISTDEIRGAYIIDGFNAGVVSEMMKKLFGVEDIKKTAGTEPTGFTAAQITEKYIPHPFSPNIFENIMKFQGRWKGNVMPGFEQEMKNQGWSMYDAMGERQYYSRAIEGNEVKISVTVKEAGGPSEAEAVTIITIELVK